MASGSSKRYMCNCLNCKGQELRLYHTQQYVDMRMYTGNHQGMNLRKWMVTFTLTLVSLER